MKKDFRVYIDDIVESCNRIEKYITGINKEAFIANDELQDAVMRRLEIIGEATTRLPEEVKTQHTEITWRKATAMRNILIHMYDEVDLDIVWQTITEDLPTFKKKLEEILQK